MSGWVLAILALVGVTAVALVAWAVTRRRAEANRAARERRGRYAVPETAERVPLAPERGDGGPVAPVAEIDPVSNPMPREQRPATGRDASVDVDARGPVVTGRLVNTPDGEMILTTPPFALRGPLFPGRSGRFVNMLMRRVPAWVAVCPKVRLDALLTPTRPDGRDPADWREWRRRVRVRSVDLVLCDRRDWRPVVAVVFDPRPAVDARAIAGGQDRIIDEVLAGVGLPLLRLSGVFEKDWPVIKPYVDELILPSVDERRVIEASYAQGRVEGAGGDEEGGAVNLLRMDDSRGGILE